MIPFLIAATLAVAPAPPESVRFFEGTYSEALTKAASAKVPLFVDFYTDWCGWCKVLDEKVYTDAAVANVLNTKFVAYKINAEKGEGPDLKKQFNIGGYPTLVVIDPQTKEEMDRLVGYSPAPKFLKSLSEITSGNSFVALKKKTEANPKDVDPWFLYGRKLVEREDAEGAKAAFEKVVALDSKDEKGKGSLAEVELGKIGAMMSGDFKPLVAAATKHDGKPAALEAHAFLAMVLSDTKDADQYEQSKKSFEYLVTHGRRESETLNGYAWLLATHGEALEKALALANEAVKLEPNSPSILDTLAECLFRLGRKDEAIAAAKKALEAASTPQEKKSFQERLEYFQNDGKKPPKEKSEGDDDEDDGR